MMHHLNQVKTTIDESLRRARLGLHQEKAQFMDSNLELLKDSYVNYNRYGEQGSLCDITPLWADTDADSEQEKSEKQRKRNLAKALYDSDRPIINKHWEELKDANGGRTLICPICGTKECEDMDHYIPRSIMPEYSVHLSNLIPLCHRCNINKGDKWLNEQGQRLIFNAYYDCRPDDSPIKWHIELCETDGLPIICMDYNPEGQQQGLMPGYSVVHSTIEKLELLEVYKTEMETGFRKELVRIEVVMSKKTSRESKDLEWEEMKRTYQRCLQRDVWSTTDVWMFETIIHSQEMDSWVSRL